jgi:hypothetical protein
MGDDQQPERLGRLRDDSDALIEALDDMRDTENRKREKDVSTPEFHRLADEVLQKSRHVFDLALGEEVNGNAIETTDQSIEETA